MADPEQNDPNQNAGDEAAGVPTGGPAENAGTEPVAGAADETVGGAGEQNDDLSQEAIDAMMAEASSGGVQQIVFRHNGVRFDKSETPLVELHDFANPMVIDEPVIRLLRQKHDDFAAFVSARLSMFLRKDFSLRLQRIAAISYRRFTSSVPNPSHVAVFKMAPLSGVGVLEIAPQLGLSIVERMLGGKGELEEAPEALSEIEMNLLDDILMVILEEWCRLWGGDQEMNASIVGRENGGRYLQTSASETVMLVVAFEGSMGECTERVQLAFPFPSVEGILRRMSASKVVEEKEMRPRARAEWRSTFNSIPIPLTVEWDACELSLRDIVGLETGSVVRLSNELVKATCVRLADVTKFVGEIGVENERLAIRIDHKVSAEEV